MHCKQCDAQVVKCDFYLYWSLPEERNEKFGWVDALLEGHVNPQVEREVFYRKPSIWSAIYRRDFLEKNDISFLPSPGASYQDAGFNFKVWASCDNSVLLNEAFLHYRQDNEKSSVNSPGKVFCVCDEYEEMHRYLDSHCQARIYLRSVLAKMRFDSYEWNYDRLSPELREQFVPRMVEDVNSDLQQGYSDLNIFEPSKRLNLILLLHDSKLYGVLRSSDGSRTRKERFVRLMRAGGLLSAIRLALFRLTH